mgnify:CR=1 FL=1
MAHAAATRVPLGNASRAVSTRRADGTSRVVPVVPRESAARPTRDRRSSAACHGAATELAQIALRDDYDPVIFLFCANALFLSVVLNVLNFGLDRDPETGDVTIPEGGLREMSRRTAAGFAGWFKIPLQRALMSDELQMAIEELKVAKRDAFLARGTPQAQETATRFMKAREKCVRLGLPEDAALLAAASAEEE